MGIAYMHTHSAEAGILRHSQANVARLVVQLSGDPKSRVQCLSLTPWMSTYVYGSARAAVAVIESQVTAFVDITGEFLRWELSLHLKLWLAVVP